MFLKIFSFYFINLLYDIVFAIDERNLCYERCEFCCREQMCRSKEVCDGTLMPLMIICFY